MISTPGSVLGEAIETAPPAPMPGDLNDELITTDSWTDDMVQRAGIPIVDVPIVTCGGGMGSFVFTNYLRVAGADTSQIRVLSNLDYPWQTYEYLTKVSQIPRDARLRSDSQSRPDCLWGFPSYALHEARRDKRLHPIWNVLSEPVLADYWTPLAGTVFATMEKEAARIRYREMLVTGQVRMVRRRADGGYFTILTPPPGASATRRIAYRSQFVHLAIGYPGLKFLPDLQEYRTKYNDLARTVNAYEPHEHVYESLLRKPGKVLVRGGGVVASRVLQRLMEDRINKGAQTEILHLFRTYYSGRHNKWGLAKRRGAYGFAFQGFNAPKSAWGGQHIDQMLKLEGTARKDLYELTGGAHTPYRKLWLDQMKLARQAGWYTTYQGEVTDVRPGTDGVITTIKQKNASMATLETSASTGCSPTCSTTPAPGATRSDDSTSTRASRYAGRAAAPGECTGRERQHTAATSRVSTRSSACSSPPNASPTTSPRRASSNGSASPVRSAVGGNGSATRRSRTSACGRTTINATEQ